MIAGAGDGEGSGDETPPRLIRGHIKGSDLPKEAVDAKSDAAVEVQYVVLTDGRVGGCRVTRTSGDRAFDAAVCGAIQRRFRFDPSRDAAGRPVEAEVVETHTLYALASDQPER